MDWLAWITQPLDGAGSPLVDARGPSRPLKVSPLVLLGARSQYALPLQGLCHKLAVRAVVRLVEVKAWLGSVRRVGRARRGGGGGETRAPTRARMRE